MTRRFYVLEDHTEVYIGNPQGYVGCYLESEHSIQTGTRSHNVRGTAIDEYPLDKTSLQDFQDLGEKSGIQAKLRVRKGNRTCDIN